MVLAIATVARFVLAKDARTEHEFEHNPFRISVNTEPDRPIESAYSKQPSRVRKNISYSLADRGLSFTFHLHILTHFASFRTDIFWARRRHNLDHARKKEGKTPF